MTTAAVRKALRTAHKRALGAERAARRKYASAINSGRDVSGKRAAWEQSKRDVERIAGLIPKAPARAKPGKRKSRKAPKRRRKSRK